MSESDTFPEPEQTLLVKLVAPQLSGFEFWAQFVAFKGAHQFELILPSEVRKDVLLSGLKVILEYSRADAHYQLAGRIDYISIRKNKNQVEEIYLLVGTGEKPTRIQRRNYFRIPARLLVKFGKVVLPPKFLEDARVRRDSIATWLKNPNIFTDRVVSLDLSGGGMALEYSKHLAVKTVLLLQFKFEDRMMTTTGVVCSCKWNGLGKNRVYNIGINFIGISDLDQEAIVQFVFKRQNVKPSES